MNLISPRVCIGMGHMNALAFCSITKSPFIFYEFAIIIFRFTSGEINNFTLGNYLVFSCFGNRREINFDGYIISWKTVCNISVIINAKSYFISSGFCITMDCFFSNGFSTIAKIPGIFPNFAVRIKTCRTIETNFVTNRSPAIVTCLCNRFSIYPNLFWYFSEIAWWSWIITDSKFNCEFSWFRGLNPRVTGILINLGWSIMLMSYELLAERSLEFIQKIISNMLIHLVTLITQIFILPFYNYHHN